MDETAEPVRCPRCATVVTVEAGWRVVRCPRCGDAIVRMSDEPAFD